MLLKDFIYNVDVVYFCLGIQVHRL
jgi:hypothetical protein